MLCLGDPGGARTLDPLIKSQLLYQLSYGVFCIHLSLKCGAKLRPFFEPCKFLRKNFAKIFSLLGLAESHFLKY